MSTNLTTLTIVTTMPASHLLTPAAMPVAPVNRAQLSGWRIAEQDQDVRIIDRGYATKFSTPLGPPPCSPPV